MTFHERKARRTDYYNRFVFRWKLRKCVACNGTNSVNGFYTRSDKGFRCTRCALLDLTRGGIAANFKLEIAVMDSFVNEQGQTAADILPGIEAQLQEFGLKVSK